MRFFLTIAVPAMIFLTCWIVAQEPGHELLASVLLPLQLLTLAYVGVGVWGLAAIWLEENQQQMSEETVVINKESWHYRLNKKMTSGWNYWTPPNSECEYWATTLDNVICLGPINVVLSTGVALIKFLIAWPLGTVLSYTPAWREAGNLLEGDWWQRERHSYGYKQQLVGPILAVLGIAGFLLWLNPLIAVSFVGVVLFMLFLIRFFEPVCDGVVTVTKGTGRAVGRSWIGQIVSYLVVRRLVCRKVIYK